MRKGWKILYIISFIFLLSGCGKREVRPPAVVTRVEIRCLHAGERMERCYTEESQIRSVLDCLRLQKSKGTAQVDPERLSGDVFEIRVCLSDGKEHIYRHRGGEYLSRDSRPWQTVDRSHGQALYNLLWEYL